MRALRCLVWIATAAGCGWAASPAWAGNTLYADNRAPLRDKPFLALPLGSVKARGWLLKQLELQRDGLTGRAEEVLPELDANSGWLGGRGESWEKGPYYLKGLVPLAYTLDDPTLRARAQKWIEWTLESQRSDGFYGPASNNDWWPRMVMNYTLRDYAEATGDPRVVPFLIRYFLYQATELAKRPLRDWGKARAGDEIDTIGWLYNRTGDALLLELMEALRQQAYDWPDIYRSNRFQWFGDDYHPKHNVNVPQAMKFPPVCWQLSGSETDRTAGEDGWRHLQRDHGVSFGLNTGTEFLAGPSSGQGVEFCSIVEQMLSDETALRILGDAALGDRLEQLAFNALPAAWTKDLKALQYYTLANAVIAKRGRNGFLQDYDDALLPGPHSGCHCCCYNVHMGWPKFVQSCWAATADNGLAVLAYAPSEVRARVADDVEVRVTEDTQYPFREEVRLTLATPRRVLFPLSLRLPGWCETPVVKVNGKPQRGLKPGTFFRLEREWRDGDVVTVELPMRVRVDYGVNRSAHVAYGPLLFSLRIPEQWTIVSEEPHGFHEYEVTPATDWNYALVLDAKRPERSFEIQRRELPDQPFNGESAPIVLVARARRLPDWGLAWHGRVAFDPPISPVRSTEPPRSVTLVPFGSQTLRVTDFPWIGEPRPPERSFRDDFDDGDAAGWVTYGGGWFVRDGQLQTASNAGGDPWPGVKAVATATQFTNLTYEGEVAVGPTGNAGLLFRVTKPSVGPDAYQGYYVGLSAIDQRIELGRADGTAYHPLASANLGVEPNQRQRLKVVARGVEIEVFAGDRIAPRLTVKDGAYASGAIGVRQFGSPAAVFDNLAVRAE